MAFLVLPVKLSFGRTGFKLRKRKKILEQKITNAGILLLHISGYILVLLRILTVSIVPISQVYTSRT